MARYFLDTSAIAKRYVFEPGRQWIHGLCEPPGQHELYVSELTLVEVVNVLCVKAEQKKQGKPPRRHGPIMKERDELIALFLKHCDPQSGQYSVLRMDSQMFDQAIALRMHYSMDSGDALQLASALALRQGTSALGRGAPEFICTDRGLCNAAVGEGFVIHNPEDHATPDELAAAGGP